MKMPRYNHRAAELRILSSSFHIGQYGLGFDQLPPLHNLRSSGSHVIDEDVGITLGLAFLKVVRPERFPPEGNRYYEEFPQNLFLAMDRFGGRRANENIRRGFCSVIESAYSLQKFRPELALCLERALDGLTNESLEARIAAICNGGGAQVPEAVPLLSLVLEAQRAMSAEGAA